MGFELKLEALEACALIGWLIIWTRLDLFLGLCNQIRVRVHCIFSYIVKCPKYQGSLPRLSFYFDFHCWRWTGLSLSLGFRFLLLLLSLSLQSSTCFFSFFVSFLLLFSSCFPFFLYDLVMFSKLNITK